MAALDFPDNPVAGDLYGSAGTVWRWDGARWASTAGASGARGRVAYAQAVANQTGIVAQTQVLTCSFVADPARTYRTSWFAGAYSTVAGDWALFKVTDAAGVQKQLQVPPVLSNTYGQQIEGSLVETGLSGATTRRLTLERLAGTGSIAFNAGASQPAFILVEDITYEAGSAGGPTPPAPSWASATIPGFNWFISGGAGASAANPRAMSLASLAVGTVGDITLTDSNTTLTFNSAGAYLLNFNIQVSGHWVAWVQVRQYRASTIINGATAQDSRGTWGNPPGVTGFDGSYVRSFAGSTILGVLPGDRIQSVIWTTGGADATSVVGDNLGYSRLSVARIAA